MSRITSGRLALAVSSVSLVVAMGGVGYAATQIGTAQLKNNAVTSAKIKNSNVTGQDVKESSLAKVPSAAKADSATTVGTFRVAKIPTQTVTGSPTAVFQGGGLTVLASCTAGYTRFTATTSKQDSSIFSYLVDLESSNTVYANDLENSGFDIGTTYDMDGSATDGATDPALVTFEFDAIDGTVATGTLKSDFNCIASGLITVG